MTNGLKIMLVAVPVMGMSFYGTHIVMQQLSQSSSPQNITYNAPKAAVKAAVQTALITGQGDVHKRPAQKGRFVAVKLSKEADAFFEIAGRGDRVDFIKTALLQTPNKTPLMQVAEIVPAPVAPIIQAQKRVKPVAAVQIAQATSPDPYIEDVAPSDVNNSILYQASTQKSWSNALVTSAFKAYGPKGGTIEKTQKEDSVQKAIAITPRILPSGRAFGGFTENEFQKRELRCMATGLYFEARSEPIRGQLAVGQVIMNRVRSPDYPDTICGVIFQGDHRNTGCQFSFACDGKTDRPSNQRLWKRSQKLATDLTKGKVWLKDIANSTHYHADYVHPKWRRSMRRLKKIGRHIFYKSPNVSTTDTFQSVKS